jgi:hypothetical protein
MEAAFMKPVLVKRENVQMDSGCHVREKAKTFLPKEALISSMPAVS